MFAFAFSFRCMATFKRVLNRRVFDENAQRINVDRRPKSIEMSAFSKEDAFFLPMGKWLLPTGKQRFVCDRFPQGKKWRNGYMKKNKRVSYDSIRSKFYELIRAQSGSTNYQKVNVQ